MEAVVVEVSLLSNNDDELNLSLGDVITNVVQIDNTWCEGQLHGKKGRFREEYVKLITKDSSKGSLTDGETKILRKEVKRHTVKALYSYAPSNDDELELKVHDVIEVIEQTEEGWWKGILNDSVGMFPSNFVAEINLDLPDTTALKGESALKSAGKRNSHIIPANISASPPSHKELKPKSNATSNEESSKTNSTAASDNKRSSLIMKKSVSSASDLNAPQLPPKPVREQAKVLYPYEAQNEDELTLKEGDIIFVISKEIEDKGWWKGELNNQIGVFPDNFVEPIKTEEIVQKKPERPDKPVVPPVPTKVGSNVEFQEKLNAELLASSKKVHKYPPAKPPPPEIHKKEEKPERPLPPHSIKKPQLPPPMKKPLRSSLGMRLPSSSSTSSASNSVSSPVSDSPPPTSIGSSTTAFSHKSVPHLPSPDESIKQRLPCDSVEDKNAHEFDLLEVSTDKLMHVTANRAKFPNRRPPSHVFLRENEKENGIPEDAKLIKDVEETPLKFKPTMRESQSKEVKVCKPVVIPSHEEKPKVPPYRPALPAQLRTTVTKVSKPEPLNAPQPAVPHIIQASTPSIPSSEPSSVKVSKKEKVRESITTDLAKDQNAFQIELSQLRNEIKKLKESSIAKTEYEKLATTVLQLKEAFEMHKSECKKQIQDLKAELEEEKKWRATMQKEKRKE